jgi:nitrogen fixation NifU-like protein
MSNLDDLYREIILDHYRSPRNRGELETPPAIRVEGFNPLCGDEIVVYLDVEEDVLKNIKMTGTGCSISQSSASLMSAAVKGKSLEQVRATIATFKELMTVHESTLAHDDPGRRQVPRAHQVRDAVVEHAHSRTGRSRLILTASRVPDQTLAAPRWDSRWWSWSRQEASFLFPSSWT